MPPFSLSGANHTQVQHYIHQKPRHSQQVAPGCCMWLLYSASAGRGSYYVLRRIDLSLVVLTSLLCCLLSALFNSASAWPALSFGRAATATTLKECSAMLHMWVSDVCALWGQPTPHALGLSRPVAFLDGAAARGLGGGLHRTYQVLPWWMVGHWKC